jgi:non-ribosomal peptide synthetase component F
MLGILAAGRAYVALDADHPIERNRQIAVEAGVCVVISAGDFAADARCLFPHNVPIIDIEALPERSSKRPNVRSKPDDLGCIYYTSGSTAMPKGIALSHSNLLQIPYLITNAAHISCDDRLLMVQSASVIAANRCLYSALLNGASLHILKPHSLEPRYLAHRIRARGVTIYYSVPTLLRRLADSLGADERLDDVRIACLGGDRIEWSDVDHCRRIFSRNVFVHANIGSTETAGAHSGWFIDAALRATTPRPPVGRPAPERMVTIVDDDGNPVADGEVGEIVVASPYLALGYWHDGVLTTGAFTIDPADPKSRVFKTGDMGRMRPDGLLEFAGRNDQQIKIRGHRIEIV